MKHKESFFRGAEGLKLYYQSWHPLTEPRGVVIIIHGLGNHSSLYVKIAEHLIRKNYAVYAFDLRGHGRSPGQRGHINSWKLIRTDLKNFVKLVETQLPGCPQFLIGHSFGAIVALDYVMRFSKCPSLLFGVITLAPPIGKLGISPLRLTIGKILSKILPRFTLSTGLKFDTSGSDQKVLAAYAQDKLRHNRGSAKLATEFLDTVNWINTHAAELQIPLLIIQGNTDRVALPEGSYQFIQKLTSQDKELWEYTEIGHRIQHNEQVISDLESWLERHLFPSEEKGFVTQMGET